MTDTQTAAPKGPASKFDKALEKAKELGGVKPETAKVIEEASKVAEDHKEPKLGVSETETSSIDVQLPDPVAEKKSAEIQVIEPAKIDRNGQIIFTPKHLELIKNQIAKDATPEEYDLFVMMARRTRLDPLLKQLYFIKYGGNVSYVTSIDSYRIVAHRTGEFVGVDLPIFDYDKNGRPTHAAITVYRLVQGVRCAFSAKVKFSEYTTGKNQWNSKPETMIAKVAEAHALRKAFPQDLSGIYTSDEMEQAQEQGGSSSPKKQAKPYLSKDQLKTIKQLIIQKELDEVKILEYMKKAYKKLNYSSLNVDQAKHLIGILESKPDPEPVELEENTENDVPQEDVQSDFTDFVEGEYDTDAIADDVADALG